MRGARIWWPALVILSVLAADPLSAKLNVDPCDGAPLYAPDENVARALLKVAMGPTFDVLDKSERTYRVSFDTEETISKAFDRPVQALALLAGYMEKDVGCGGFFTMHVNADWVRRDLDIGIQKAGESFNNLSDEEKDKRLILAYRICALGIIAHEGQHCAQVERMEIGFGEKLVAPALHQKLGHDRYDEFGGKQAQREVIYRVVTKTVPADKQEILRQEALADVETAYPSLPAKFLVVRGGKEVEAKAPFVWPEVIAGESKSTAAFKSALARMATDAKSGAQTELEALGGNSETSDGHQVSGGGEPSGEIPDGEPGADSEEALGRSYLAGDMGIELGNVPWEPLERILERTMAGGQEGEQTEAMAKAAKPVQRADGQYGTDPFAARLDP